MAFVRNTNKQRGSIAKQDTEVDMDVTVGMYNGSMAVRIGSVGSDERETKKKTSQVYVLDETQARQLYDILKNTFGF